MKDEGFDGNYFHITTILLLLGLWLSEFDRGLSFVLPRLKGLGRHCQLARAKRRHLASRGSKCKLNCPPATFIGALPVKTL